MNGDYDFALNTYDEILYYFDDLEVLSRKIKILQLLERDDEAIQILDNMIAEDNEKKWALINKGLCYEGIDNKKAMEFIDDVLENDYDNHFAHYAKASVLFDMREYEESKTWLGQVLLLNDDFNENFIFLLAKLMYSCGEIELATNTLDMLNDYHYHYDDSLDLRLEMYQSGKQKKLLNNELDNAPAFDPLANNPQDSPLLQQLGDDVEFFDNLPDKKDLETIKDYEDAINDFYTEMGKEYFERNEGHFWGILGTRHFMRQLFSLADLLWEVGRREESVEKLKWMIKLNPNDNQGVRDTLWTRLLELNRFDELEKYFKMFEKDRGTFMIYTKLLSAIKLEEDETVIKSLFDEALKTNKYVPLYLTDKYKIPGKLPDFYSFGDENEAIFYVNIAYNAWHDDKVAIEKLKELFIIN
jgi:tetratricopeptide (TPR) repeat protein